MLSTTTATTTVTTSVLMPLSWLTGAGNFCFKFFWPFFSIAPMLFFQVTSFQIFLYALFSRFPWSNLLPFTSYSKLHKLHVLTDDMTIPLQAALHYHILGIHNDTHPISKNISRDPIDQPHPYIILIVWHPAPHNFASSATVSSHVSQQCHKIDLTEHW